MAAVFGEPGGELSDEYVAGLLARPSFWAIADDDEDAHALEFYRTLGGDASAVSIFMFER